MPLTPDELRKILVKSQLRRVTVQIEVTDTLLLRADPNRISIVINPPATNRFTVRVGEAAVLDQGITFAAGIHPVCYTILDSLPLVTGEWRAISAVGAQNVTVYETVLVH